MTEIKKLWSSDCPDFPHQEIAEIENAAQTSLAQAACCFWLFRLLHRVASPRCVLLGDYCFGRFSQHLAELESIELTNAFSSYLKNDTLGETAIGDYLRFIEKAKRMI